MIYDLILFGAIIAWSLQKIIDKGLVDNSNSSALFADWAVITHFFIILPFLYFVELISLKYLGIIFFLSVLSVISNRFLYKGMKKDEVSRTTPFSQFSGVFAVVLSVLILGERPSTINFLGVVLMVFAAYLISSEKPFRNLKEFVYSNKAIVYVLIAALISSFNTVVNKQVLFGVSALSLMFFRRLTSFLIVSPSLLKKPDIKDWPLFFSARILSTGGLLGFFYVLSKQELYLTVPILAVQPLLVLFFSHNVLKEKKFFKNRLVSILILIVGYVLLKI
ncbi:EamA family transporter [Candidatus Woesearchaeota archaeon]|nr:EamA family transporter [Candidatus Woesearchaeota archaeon]